MRVTVSTSTREDDPYALDEPALSPSRIVHAVAWWLWFSSLVGPHDIGLWHLVATFHRPYYSHLKGKY